jgi:hypothetical protein
VLPIQDIELAFTPAVFVCMELPVGPNSLDVLLATPQGKLVAVECKLWRNPEAKRKVIAQAIDYGAGLQAFTHEQLQKAIRAARRDDSFRLVSIITSLTSPESRNPRLRRQNSLTLFLRISGPGTLCC